jgi:hypothetical protein
MREYLSYSLAQANTIMPIHDWQSLKPSEHETLAALRVRFSEYQEELTIDWHLATKRQPLKPIAPLE